MGGWFFGGGGGSTEGGGGGGGGRRLGVWMCGVWVGEGPSVFVRVCAGASRGAKAVLRSARAACTALFMIHTLLGRGWLDVWVRMVLSGVCSSSSGSGGCAAVRERFAPSPCVGRGMRWCMCKCDVCRTAY